MIPSSADSPEPDPRTPGGRIVFIRLSESLGIHIQSQVRRHVQRDAEDPLPEEDEPGFVFDPSIPIPVELPAGEDGENGGEGEEGINPEEITLEMILSGMLRVLAGEESPPPFSPAGEGGGPPRWPGYYRRLVLSLRPGIEAELTGAAVLKARNGDYALALEILAALRALCPGSSPVLLNQALVLEERAAALERAGQETMAERDYLAAEAVYGEALVLENPVPDVLFNAGLFFLKRRDYSRALVCFRAYGSLEDQDDGAGGFELSPEKRENALTLAREIEEHGLQDEDFREAWDCVRRGREREGMDRIRLFLERRPGVWNGWFLLGWALRRLERWADARSALEKAVELGGDNCDTRNELAICLMELKDYAGARRQLESALRRDAENIKIISNLGVLALKTGNKGEAAGFFRTVLELEPEDPLARRYLSAKDGEGEA
ncbi:MAG: tetratricopeptide repeat protein [Treponema sp.]|nr:tetratricopeptide repeat protein [Treponema sp.]